MRRPILLIIPIVLVTLYSLTLRGASSQIWILPGAAETTGLFGAQFSSTLYVTNDGENSTAVQIGFIPYAGKPVPAPANLTITAGGKNLGTISFSFLLGEWIQKNIGDWFSGISIPDNARVDVQISSGSLDGYASRIDNGTGDAVVLPLTLLNGTTESGNGPQLSGCPIFPSNNPWNRDISNDPVDPNSSNYIAHMNGNTKFLHPDFGSNPTYGIPYIVVPGSQTKVPMTFDYADESDPGPYPIPPNPRSKGAINLPGTAMFSSLTWTIASCTKPGIRISSDQGGIADPELFSIYAQTVFARMGGLPQMLLVFPFCQVLPVTMKP